VETTRGRRGKTNADFFAHAAKIRGEELALLDAKDPVEWKYSMVKTGNRREGLFFQNALVVAINFSKQDLAYAPK
jgi:hypothetical protein